MSELHESLARLLAGNQFTESPHGSNCGVGDHERALFRYAAATTKAVAVDTLIRPDPSPPVPQQSAKR